MAPALKLATQEGAWAPRLSVAVWVADAQEKPVRQIAQWYKKPKCLEDTRFWCAACCCQFAAGNRTVGSTTSATRSPGKHTLKRDGKNDQRAPA